MISSARQESKVKYRMFCRTSRGRERKAGSSEAGFVPRSVNGSGNGDGLCESLQDDEGVRTCRRMQ